MTMRGIHAQTAIQAGFGLAAAVFALLAWALLEIAAEVRIPQGVLPRPERVPIMAGLAAAGLAVIVLGLALRQSRASQHAQSRLRETVDGLPGAVYRLRRTAGGASSYDFLGGNLGKVSGIEREELHGDAQGVGDRILDEDRHLLDSAMTRSAREASALSVQFRVRKPDGVVRWLQCSANPVPQAGGDTVWHGHWSDITDMKTTELELRQTAERFNDAQHIAGIGNWTCDLASGALTWSQQLYAILQRDPGRGPPSLEEAVALLDEGAGSTADAFLRAQETGETQAYEATIRLANRGTVALQVIVVPVRDATGAVVGMRGTIQDITAWKALESRLSAAREAAEIANRAKSIFLASMSHEIRTPMNGILGILELISLKPLDPDLRGALDVVRESGKSMQRIIDDILDFSKVEAGKLEVRPEPTSIYEVVADVHRIYSESAGSLGLELRHDIDPRITPTVMVDGLRLRQILGNFVSNAIKFTPSGRVEMKVQLLEREGARELLRFVVVDTGIGISQEAQRRLFQPFEQADTTLAMQHGGTGLGLSICRRLAELMGGTVGMSSEPGQGTSMSLDLPVIAAAPRLLEESPAAAPDGAANPTHHHAAPGVGQAGGDGRLVLVVDDHPINRLVMRRQLSTLGFAAEDVESGAEALELWRSGRFALVLTDCHMPGMTGYELSQRIREIEDARGGGRTPIIACSADVLAGVVEDCLNAGMDDYISKPTELRLLAEKVARWLPLPSPQVGEAAGPAAAADFKGPLPGESSKEGWALKARAGSEPVLTTRVIEQFRRVNDEDARQLLDVAEQGDMQAVAHFAHRIKGACGFIGAAPLASVCAMVEQAGRAEDAPGVSWLMDAFRTELEQLNAHLDTY